MSTLHIGYTSILHRMAIKNSTVPAFDYF